MFIQKKENVSVTFEFIHFDFYVTIKLTNVININIQ